MFRRGNPFVCAREETSSTCGASHLRAGLSLSWPSHVHIQPNLLKSCQMIVVTLASTMTALSRKWSRGADNVKILYFKTFLVEPSQVYSLDYLNFFSRAPLLLYQT